MLDITDIPDDKDGTKYIIIGDAGVGTSKIGMYVEQMNRDKNMNIVLVDVDKAAEMGLFNSETIRPDLFDMKPDLNKLLKTDIYKIDHSMLYQPPITRKERRKNKRKKK